MNKQIRIPNAVFKTQKPTEEEWLYAHEPKVTWSNGLLVGKTIAKVEILNDDAELMTLTFIDGSCLCVVYKAYAP